MFNYFLLSNNWMIRQIKGFILFVGNLLYCTYFLRVTWLIRAASICLTDSKCVTGQFRHYSNEVL